MARSTTRLSTSTSTDRTGTTNGSTGTTSTDDGTDRAADRAAERTAERTADHAADVARARAGDQAAWSALVRRYERLLRHIARSFRLGGDDVEDVVQQTWLICVERLHQLQDDACFVGWLSTVCRHECTRHVTRARRCEPVDPTADVLGGTPPQGRCADPDAEDLADLLAHREDLANLRAAIDALPARQRDVLRALSSADFDDYVSTALRTGIPVGSLGPTRRRALARLQTDPRLALAG